MCAEPNQTTSGQSNALVQRRRMSAVRCNHLLAGDPSRKD
jgi:hypothetical protein